MALRVYNNSGAIVYREDSKPTLTWTVLNGSSDRVFDASQATVEDLANVIAQMIADSQYRGVFA